MFGFSVHTTITSDRLVVSSPINLLLLLVLAVFTIWPLVIFCFQRPFPRRKVAIHAAITLLVFGILPSGARITLDRTSERATVSKYFFFHWTTETMALSAIDTATLRTGSGTSQIQLNFSDGSSRILSELNQAGGKEQAVFDINNFLSRRASEDHSASPVK